MNLPPIVLDARTAAAHFPGIGRYTTGLARALAALDPAPRMALLHGPTPDPRLPVPALPGIVCAASPFGVRQQWDVRRILHASEARVYHSPYYMMPFAPGVRTVVTCYDMIPLTVPGLFGRSRRAAYRMAHALAFRASASVLVPTEHTRREVSRLFPAHAAKIEVVPLGWDFVPGSGIGAAAHRRRQLGVPQEYVLSVGGNKPHKNLRRLVEAWEEIATRRAPARLPVLVLAGPRDARYDDGGPAAVRLRQSGRSISLGSVSDEALEALYRGAMLVVCPSIAEGFGLPVIEAMGCGAPVACSAIPALTEVTAGAAATFDPLDTDAIASVLDRLLGAPDERDTLRQAGRRRAGAFTWERSARATLAVYDRLLGGPA